MELKKKKDKKEQTVELKAELQSMKTKKKDTFHKKRQSKIVWTCEQENKS